MKHVTLLAMLLFGFGSALAQDCVSLIALSKTVSTRTYDKKTIDDNAAAFCSDYRKSKISAGDSNFGASYKFLSASMGKSNASAEEVSRSYCQQNDTYAARSDAYNEYIETIAPQAYPAYQACLQASNNLTFGLTSVLPTEFMLLVAHQSRGQGATAQVTFGASNDVTCAWQEESTDVVPKLITMPSGTTRVLKCQRQDPTKQSYAQVVRRDWSDLKDSTITIPWQAYDKNGLPLNALEELRNEVLQARQALSARGVGEIVASMLSVTKFQETYNINGEQWELAKGQDAPAGSKYLTEVGAKLPDLRGVFLRGKNHGREAATGNPEGELEVGVPQKDDVIAHTHGLTQLGIGGNEDNEKSDNVRADFRNPVPKTTDSFGGQETRPRNVTVNYFIRVN